MEVVKGRKYLLAGEFRKDQHESIKKELEEMLSIDIVGFITSSNTMFIEYIEEDNRTKIKEENAQMKLHIEKLYNALKEEKANKKSWFK